MNRRHGVKNLWIYYSIWTHMLLNAPSQLLLRECGFVQVAVTKKSGDGGIDGTGKLKINGIFSFRVAFQCKRYKGSVGSAEIRDFRSSLTTDIEREFSLQTVHHLMQPEKRRQHPVKSKLI